MVHVISSNQLVVNGTFPQMSTSSLNQTADSAAPAAAAATSATEVSITSTGKVVSMTRKRTHDATEDSSEINPFAARLLEIQNAEKCTKEKEDHATLSLSGKTCGCCHGGFSAEEEAEMVRMTEKLEREEAVLHDAKRIRTERFSLHERQTLRAIEFGNERERDCKKWMHRRAQNWTSMMAAGSDRRIFNFKPTTHDIQQQQYMQQYYLWDVPTLSKRHAEVSDELCRINQRIAWDDYYMRYAESAVAAESEDAEFRDRIVAELRKPAHERLVCLALPERGRLRSCNIERMTLKYLLEHKRLSQERESLKQATY